MRTSINSILIKVDNEEDRKWVLEEAPKYGTLIHQTEDTYILHVYSQLNAEGVAHTLSQRT